jgi:hypothetical protein
MVWNRRPTDGLFVSHAPGKIQRHPVGPVGFMTQDTTQSQSAYCEVGLAVAPLQPQD